MQEASALTIPLSLNPLQVAILEAVARYEYGQDRPVTVRDIYRRLRLNKEITLKVVRELKDMGLLDVNQMTANNRLKVMTIATTQAGQEWILN